jgi:hypothetical protein
VTTVSSRHTRRQRRHEECVHRDLECIVMWPRGADELVRRQALEGFAWASLTLWMSRSPTRQVWHVRPEAHHQIRAAAGSFGAKVIMSCGLSGQGRNAQWQRAGFRDHPRAPDTHG